MCGCASATPHPRVLRSLFFASMSTFNEVPCRTLDSSAFVMWRSDDQVLFISQAMRLQQANLWYPSSSGRSRPAETSRSSSLSSQHCSLAVELAVQRGLSCPRYLTPSALERAKLFCFFCFIARFSISRMHRQRASLMSFPLHKAGLNPDIINDNAERREDCFSALVCLVYANEILLAPSRNRHSRHVCFRGVVLPSISCVSLTWSVALQGFNAESRFLHFRERKRQKRETKIKTL